MTAMSAVVTPVIPGEVVTLSSKLAISDETAPDAVPPGIDYPPQLA